MSDIQCRACGEPWDTFTLYAIEDATIEERTKVLSGVGCWACAWGTKCPQCSGTGEREHYYGHEFGIVKCATCDGTGKPTLRDEQYTEALYSLMNSDEDVSVYL